MATVLVTPTQFSYVQFDPGRIVALVDEVATRIGFDADALIRVEIDESVPLGRSRVAGLEPVTLTVEGGAFENAKRPRTLSEKDVVDVAGRLLHRAHDRLDPDFGEAPPDEQLTLQQATAWDAYGVGRSARLGYAPAQPRFRYHFRNRHGFTDVADAVFDRLWHASALRWADIEAACAETAAAAEASTAS